jgi:hypothetical protein
MITEAPEVVMQPNHLFIHKFTTTGSRNTHQIPQNPSQLHMLQMNTLERAPRRRRCLLLAGLTCACVCVRACMPESITIEIVHMPLDGANKTMSLDAVVGSLKRRWGAKLEPQALDQGLAIATPAWCSDCFLLYKIVSTYVDNNLKNNLCCDPWFEMAMALDY